MANFEWALGELRSKKIIFRESDKSIGLYKTKTDIIILMVNGRKPIYPVDNIEVEHLFAEDWISKTIDEVVEEYPIYKDLLK